MIVHCKSSTALEANVRSCSVSRFVRSLRLCNVTRQGQNFCLTTSRRKTNRGRGSTGAYASLGQGRARFKRELERLSRLDYAAIVIEASLPNFLKAPAFSRMNPKAAVNSLIAWSVKYNVHLFFAGDRRHGHALTRQLLQKYLHYHDGDTDVSRQG